MAAKIEFNEAGNPVRQFPLTIKGENCGIIQVEARENGFRTTHFGGGHRISRELLESYLSKDISNNIYPTERTGTCAVVTTTPEQTRVAVEAFRASMREHVSSIRTARQNALVEARKAARQAAIDAKKAEKDDARKLKERAAILRSL